MVVLVRRRCWVSNTALLDSKHSSVGYQTLRCWVAITKSPQTYGFPAPSCGKLRRHAFTVAYDAKEISGTPNEELMAMGTGTLRRGLIEGDVENGTVMCTQAVARLNEILPVKVVMENLIAEAKETLARAKDIELLFFYPYVMDYREDKLCLVKN